MQALSWRKPSDAVFDISLGMFMICTPTSGPGDEPEEVIPSLEGDAGLL